MKLAKQICPKPLTEAQRAQLGYDVVRLREIREVEAARLQALTAMPAETSFQTSPDAIAVTNPLPSLEAVRATAEEYSQELRGAGIERDRMREELRLARRAAIPDFMVGFFRYTEMVVPGAIEPGMSGPNNPSDSHSALMFRSGPANTRHEPQRRRKTRRPPRRKSRPPA